MNTFQKRFLPLLLLLAAAAAEGKNCGSISNAAGKKMQIPCSVNRAYPAKKPSTPRAAPALPQDLSASFRERQQLHKDLINRLAQQHGMDKALIHAVISVESAYQAQAISPKGAIGLMQLMPGTAADLQVNPHQLDGNIDGGVRYLKEQLQRFQRLELALAAYNAGPQNVIRYREQIPPFPETQDYVQRVLHYHQRYLNEWKNDIQ